MTYHSPVILQCLVELNVSLEVILEALLQLGQTLESMHAAGFTHNDVKPDNVSVAVTADGRVTATLLDLGLATPTGHTPHEFLCMRTDDEAEWELIEALRQRVYPWYAPELYHGGPSSPSTGAFSFAFTARTVLSLLPGPPAALLIALQENTSPAKSRLSVRELMDLLVGTLSSCRRQLH